MAKTLIESHLERKIKILEKEMLIHLTPAELGQLYKCTTISSIDQTAREIILSHWDNEEEERK